MANILIADDDQKFLKMLRQMLEMAGHQVFTAENGLEALRTYRENSVDILITDIFMPEKEGIETILELKQEFEQIKIIAISGGGRTGDFKFLNTAEELGAQTVFRKPFDRKEFLAAIDKLVDQ